MTRSTNDWKRYMAKKAWSQPVLKSIKSPGDEPPNPYLRQGAKCGHSMQGAKCGDSIIRYGPECNIRTGQDCLARTGTECNPTMLGTLCTPRTGTSCITRLGTPC